MFTFQDHGAGTPQVFHFPRLGRAPRNVLKGLGVPENLEVQCLFRSSLPLWVLGWSFLLDEELWG